MGSVVNESPSPVASISAGVTIPVAVAILIRAFGLIIGADTLIHLAAEPSRELVALTIVTVFPLVLLSSWTIAHRRVKRRFMSADATVVRDDADMLSRYGIRNVRIIVATGVRSIGWSYRRGRQVFIAVAPLTGDPTAFRFVVAHEAGHAIRNDSTRRRWGGAVATALFYGSLLSFDYRLIVATAFAIVVWSSVGMSTAEIACDRIAVRAAGVESIEAFAESYAEIMREPANRTVDMRVRRAFGLLTHPPMSSRVALARRAVLPSTVAAEPALTPS